MRYLILLTFFLFVLSSLSAQNCTPNDINLTTQADVDNFQTNFGPCNTVVGRLNIAGGANITNLNGLSGVERVEGDLRINNTSNLINVDGLANLTHVEGELRLRNNSALLNIDSLMGVTTINGNLDIKGNGQLANIDGLSKVTTIGGDITIEDNALLTNVDGLLGITTVNGTLKIIENNELTNLNGLINITTINGALRAEDNPKLSECCGLFEVISNSGVTGNIQLVGNLAAGNCNNHGADVNQACQPEIVVEGNSTNIVHNSMNPNTNDSTDFGMTLVTGGMITKTFTIKNDGVGILTLGANAVSVIGTNNGDFSIVNQPAITVDPNGMTTFTVKFDPISFDVRNATISINSDDADENPFQFDIRGTGLSGMINNVTDVLKTDLSVTDPCSCTDPENVRVNNEFLFHDVMTINGTSGQLVEIIAPNDGQFLDKDGNDITLPLTLSETTTGSGIYQLDFYHRSGQVTNLTIRMNGDPMTDAPFTSSLCSEVSCRPIPTLSQWGLMIFSLVILNLGIFFVQCRELI